MHKKKVVTMKEDTLSCSPMNSTQMSVWDHMRRQSKDTDEAVNIAFQNFLKSTVEEGYAEQGATKTHEAGTVRITTCGDVWAKTATALCVAARTLDEYRIKSSYGKARICIKIPKQKESVAAVSIL